MKIETLTLPTYWAPALINGDFSGLDDAETDQILAFERDMVADYGQCWCLGVEDDSWFSSYHDAERYGVLACEVTSFEFDVDNRK